MDFKAFIFSFSGSVFGINSVVLISLSHDLVNMSDLAC